MTIPFREYSLSVTEEFCLLCNLFFLLLYEISMYVHTMYLPTFESLCHTIKLTLYYFFIAYLIEMLFIVCLALTFIAFIIVYKSINRI
jgi:hypothetical protein